MAKKGQKCKNEAKHLSQNWENVPEMVICVYYDFIKLGKVKNEESSNKLIHSSLLAVWALYRISG